MIVTLVALAAPLSTTRAQDASELFDAGSQAFESGNYLRALGLFEGAREAGLQGPAVHYNIASCHYRLGDYAQAESNFRLIADRYPRMRTLAEYNLGLVYLRQDRDAEARQSFSAVRQESTDPSLRALADRALGRLDPPPATSTAPARWVGLVDFIVGHDDNVALIDDSTLELGQSVDSAFTEILAVVSGPLSAAPGFRFDGSLYSVDYDDTDGFNQNAARARGAYHWQAGAWRFESGPHLDYTTLDGDGFEQRVGGDLRLRRQLSPTTMLSLYVVHDEVDGADSRFAFLDGTREQVGVSWDKYRLPGRLTLSYQIELNDRRSSSVSPTRNRLSLRYRHTLNANWETDMLTAYRGSSYDDPARDDDRIEFSFGLTRTLSPSWQITGRYRWQDNDSNVVPYSYTRTRFVLGLSRNF